MKRVLFLIPTLMHGGAEKVLVNLVNNIDKEKFEVTVQTLFDVGVNKKYLNNDVKYKSNFKYIIRGYSHIFKLINPNILYKFLIREKYDIIVSYLEGQTARIVSGCNSKDTKIISWIHSEQHNSKNASKTFRNYKEALDCYNKYDNIICVAESVKNDFKNIFDYKGRIDVLYNTNESNKILNLSDEEMEEEIFDNRAMNICSVGKITAEKGFYRLAKIHKKLIDEGINNHFYILGIGEERKKIEAYLQKNNIENTFTFLGYKDNPYKYVKKSDLYVCSSLREGFSTAVTEALIVGTPVVTTLCSGMTEMLGENNEYGIITKNNEEALYNGIKKILLEPGLLDFYKSKAIERGKIFNTKKTVSAVEEMLENI